MALNIGNLNFGVDANTVGLQKAVQQLERFQKKTDQVAKSQEKGAVRTAAAFVKQESAIKKAFQQTLALQQQMRKAAVPPEQIARVSNAFKRLTTELTSGKLSVVQFTRAMDSFQAKMGRSRRKLKDFNDEARKGQGTFGRMTEVLRDLESSAVLALGPLSGLGARIRSLSQIFTRSGIRIALLAGAVVGAVVALGAITVATIKAGQAMLGLNLRFEAATGSSIRARGELQAVTRIARGLGLEIIDLGRAYARFTAASQGTSIEGAKARKIFSQVARAAAALKLEGTDVEGVMRALEQIMSKGTVQAEELRGQLGDRLPGAFRIAAEAMQVTTRELNRMLKAGEVISDEFLPKFAAQLEKSFGANAKKNLTTVSGQFNLLKTNSTLLFSALDDVTSASAVLVTGMTIASEAVGGLADAIGDTRAKARALEVEMRRIDAEAARQAALVPNLTKVYTDLNKALDKTTAEFFVQVAAIEELERSGTNLKFLKDFFVELPKAQKANNDELEKLAMKLRAITGLNIPATAKGIAAGFAEIALMARATNTEFTRLVNAPTVLRGINEQMTMLRDRVAALRAGPEVAEIFDRITVAERALRAELKNTTLTQDERSRKVAEFIALLSELDLLEKQHTKTLRDAREEQRKADQAIRRAENAMRQANNTLEIMRARLAALARGPDSLEIFEKVDAPLLRMRQRLMDAGIAGQELVDIMRELREVFEEQFSATDRFARAAEQMATATVNGLEAIIFKTNSVKEALHQLAIELLRVALRALFLDKLQASLTQIFGGGGFPAPLPSPPSPVPLPPTQHGGSFKLTGAGGNDRIPFQGVGRPGEVVTVSTPSQIAAGGGGGGVIIQQFNTFENIADPSFILPMLDESNRRLKGEIIDALDRGAL